MRKLTLLMLLLSLLVLAASARAATLYATIDGTKQGKLKGDALGSAHNGQIPVLRFSYAATSPHDATTGQATGKHPRGALILTREIDAASVQLFEAFSTNEVLKTVTLEFYRASPAGKEELYYTIHLTNATISAIHLYTEAPPAGQPNAAGAELEDISLTFQSMEVESRFGKAMAEGDSHTAADTAGPAVPVAPARFVLPKPR